ncbi:MAG: hypothetical protein GTO45_04070 [Candidatus Aminicenantes bacterium]|nr:hypothetical protein [Candidatus Aminicenantes bacterium]NIM77905.1 hypothetical protein [Candidatus Aminicenantes bacterium]NIN17216.1 hypothetical protein [Candidatus Aminicenantes bacterium]NIN41109.1 hypothetical protein [Candidatus Aminicenantes bacterium]NIN83914.1 hypothetical protein [Candidatus Aminicenantes bacterium]
MRKTALLIVLVSLLLNFGGYSSPVKPHGKISSQNAAQDSQMCSKIKPTLKSINVNVLSVDIADGRAKGGERGLIISFKTNPNPDEHPKELVKVLESVYVLNKNMNARLDLVVAIAVDSAGKTRAMIIVKASDVQWFMRTKNSVEYLKRWEVIRVDRTYLSDLFIVKRVVN